MKVINKHEEISFNLPAMFKAEIRRREVSKWAVRKLYGCLRIELPDFLDCLNLNS